MSKSIRRRSGRRHLAEALEQRTLLTAVSWDGGAGNINWTSPLNWSNDQVPTINDDVTINVPASNPNINVFGNAVAKSVTSSETMTIVSGSKLTTTDGGVINATFGIGGTLQGGAWSTTGGGTMTSQNGAIVGVTLNVPMAVTSGFSINLAGDVVVNSTFDADRISFFGTSPASLGGSGTMTIRNIASSISNGTMLGTINAGTTISVNLPSSGSQFGVSGPVRNLGAFSVNGVANTTMTFGPSFTNDGLITATGGVNVVLNGSVNNNAVDVTGGKLTVSGNWNSAAGSLTTHNSNIDLDGAFNASALSALHRNGTGTMRLLGTLTCDPTLTLNAQTGSLVTVNLSVIKNGTIVLADGASLLQTNGILENVTLASPLIVPSGQLYVSKTFTLNSTLTLGDATTNSIATLQFLGSPDARLAGSGDVLAVGNGQSRVFLESNATAALSIDSTMTIHGKNFLLSPTSIVGSITNYGTIAPATGVTGGRITLGFDITATPAPNILFSNRGTITAQDCALDIGGHWSNDGGIPIVTSNSVVQLGGSFTAAGVKSIHRTGGELRLVGLCDLTQGDLTLDANSGSVYSDANSVLQGPGQVNANAGLTLFGSGGSLADVLLNAPMTITGFRETIRGTVRLNSAVTASSASANRITVQSGSLFEMSGLGGASLSGVIVETGPVRFSENNAKLVITNGFGGAINISNPTAKLIARGTQSWSTQITFDSAPGASMVVTTDSPPPSARGGAGAGNRSPGVVGSLLTLDSFSVIAGRGGTILNDPSDPAPAGVLNQGEIRADVAGGIIHVNVASGFTNSGVARAKNGGTLTFDTMPTNYNAVASTLTGGTWEAQANSSLTFASAITATGAGTTFALIGVGASIPALINLATNGGTIQLSTNASLNHIGALTNNGTLNVVSGTLDVGGTLDGSGSAIISNAGTLKTTRVRQTGLQIFGGKVFVSANGSPQFVNVLSSIQFNGNGLIDLADNDLILQPADPNAPWLTNVEFNVNRGRNNGAWNGLGIQSSAAAAAVTAGVGNKALGVLAASQFLESNGDPSFDGIVLGGTEVLIKYTYYGDVDFNGRVDVSDYNLIDYGYVNHLTGWAWGDADGSHAVDVSDYNLIDFAFTTQNATL